MRTSNTLFIAMILLSLTACGDSSELPSVAEPPQDTVKEKPDPKEPDDKVVVDDKDGKEGKDDKNVKPNEPYKDKDITNIELLEVSQTTATITWGLSVPVIGQIFYGKTEAYGQSTTEDTSIRQKTHTKTLEGLEPGATYHFQIVSNDESGQAYISQDRTFRTLPDMTQPVTPKQPYDDNEISGIELLELTQTTAKFTWGLSAPATGQILYGETEAYGQSTTEESSFRWDRHIQMLEGLEPETTYHFQIVSKDESGKSYISMDRTFKTLAGEVEDPNKDDPSKGDPEPMTPVKGWPSNFDNDLPMGGIFYGNHQAGALTGNARIGVESSRRFRAERTGMVKSVRWNNRFLKLGNISQRCKPKEPNSKWCKCKRAGLDEIKCGYTLGNSYSVGNGGKIVIELHEDDGTSKHLPAPKVLTRTRGEFIPQENKNNEWPILNFEKPVKLTAGKLYHLVYKNNAPPTRCGLGGVGYDQAKSCPANQGAIGLNGVSYFNLHGTKGMGGPFRGSSGAVLYKSKASDPWKLDPDNLSWYEVLYDDNIWVGDAYIAYNSIFYTGKRVIKGNQQARQQFTVRDASRHVDGMWLHFGHDRRTKPDGSAMKVVLKDKSGRALATGSIKASAGCIERLPRGGYSNEECREWGYTTFDKSVMLEKGKSYSVELSASSRAGFVLSSFFIKTERPERGHWMDSVAQYSTNGGSSWGAWHQSPYLRDGKMVNDAWNPQRDLGLLFTIVGMPRRLP